MGAAIGWACETAVDPFAATRAAFERLLRVASREETQRMQHSDLERDPHCSRRWAAVVDGNETQLDILEDLAEQHGVHLTIVLDIFHVLEYLWKAGHALCAEGSTRLIHASV